MTETDQNGGAAPAPQEIPKRKPVRWWAAIVIVVLATIAVIGIRLWPTTSFQEKNIATAQVIIVSVVLELLWVLFLSRLRWLVRSAVYGAVVIVIAALAGLFRIRGVTGDLLPILEWRWQSPTTSALPASQPAITATTGSRAKLFEPTTNDFPQFLGPQRNCTVVGPTLARDWKAQPPQELWRHPVGAAWSGFVVQGTIAVTQEQRGEEELVVAYDLLIGKALWSHADAAHYNTVIAGEGPRATPTIRSNRVFTVGATGILNCLDLETGERVWTKDTTEDNHAKVNGWGMAGSPLVIENLAAPAAGNTDQPALDARRNTQHALLVIVSPGGPNGRSLVAYDAKTGDFVWGGGNGGTDYSSPFPAALAGVRQILIFNSSVVAHDATDGKVLWEYPWPGGHPHIAVPVILPGDRVLISSGYGTGAELLQIKHAADGKWSASRIWKSNRLKAKFTNVVYHDGFIYGLDDGILVCLDAADGSLKWKEGRHGHGQMILTGSLLLVSDESGDIVLVEPVPQEHRELTRFTALHSKTWNPPALAGDLLVVRNDKEAACYRLPLAQ